MTKKGYTFYSRSAGLEISATEAVKPSRIVGRVRFRVFPLEEGGRKQQVILMLDPLEAFRLSRLIRKAVSEGRTFNRALIHKSEKDGSESTAILDVEAREKESSRLYGFTVVRANGKKEGTRRVSIALDEDAMLFSAELLEKLAADTAYETYIGNGEAAAGGEKIPF